MSTWHQNQVPPRPLWDPVKWTVVTDPPGRTRTLGRYDTAAEGQAYIDSLTKHNPFEGSHSYLLPPHK